MRCFIKKYLVDFLLHPKMTAQQIHNLVYRIKRPLETTAGRIINSLKSIKKSSMLNLNALHKTMFLLLLIAYFGNRFIWGKYERAEVLEILPTSDNAEVITEREYLTVETVCRSKSQIIILVEVTFIILCAIKQISKRISDRRKIVRAAALEKKMQN